MRDPKPGLLALQACGDGFWEADLLAGCVWYSEWFYRRLGWAPEGKRTLLDLQPLLHPAGWAELLGKFRAHLERDLPLDLAVRVQLAEECIEWWHIRGTAMRNEAGQPIFLAGSVRDVSAERKPPEIAASLLCLRGAFEALPVAAALLDARSAVLKANRKWYEFSERDAARAIARLQAAQVQSAVEFPLEPHAAAGGGMRRLRVRAAAFQHNGSPHLVATLEEG